MSPFGCIYNILANRISSQIQQWRLEYDGYDRMLTKYAYGEIRRKVKGKTFTVAAVNVESMREFTVQQEGVNAVFRVHMDVGRCSCMWNKNQYGFPCVHVCAVCDRFPDNLWIPNLFHNLEMENSHQIFELEK